jgi:hypothetical protein
LQLRKSTHHQRKQMKSKLTTALAGLSLMALSCFAGAGPDLSQLPPPSDRTGLTFTNDIEPIFKASCMPCHNGPRSRGGLHLDTLEGVLNGGMHNGQKVDVITPGNSETSSLVVAVARLDPHTAMPPVRRNRPGMPGVPPAPGGPDGATNAPPNPPPPPPPPGNLAPGSNSPPMPPMPPGQGVRVGPPANSLTREQVGLVRAWIDQGAK